MKEAKTKDATSLNSLIECVPNFSEGRDRAKVEHIAAVIETVAGAHVLDVHLDPDHNRSVVTFAATRDAVAEAAIRAVGRAASVINMNQHHGEHPRVGATDVVPFVPLGEVLPETVAPGDATAGSAAMAECIAIARRAGEEIFKRFRIPVYYYGEAALKAGRDNLANIRRGGFERLKDEVLHDPYRQPDIGESQLHPTAGASLVGARRLLIAFNVNLNSDDKMDAQAIARAVRFSDGGLPHVKAMGVLLRTRQRGGPRGQAQVSMNLTDFEHTSIRQAYDAVEREAAHLGITIESSELVGMVPRRAMEGINPQSLLLANFSASKILEERIAEVFGSQDKVLGDGAQQDNKVGVGQGASEKGSS